MILTMSRLWIWGQWQDAPGGDGEIKSKFQLSDSQRNAVV